MVQLGLSGAPIIRKGAYFVAHGQDADGLRPIGGGAAPPPAGLDGRRPVQDADDGLAVVAGGGTDLGEELRLSQTRRGTERWEIARRYSRFDVGLIWTPPGATVAAWSVTSYVTRR